MDGEKWATEENQEAGANIAFMKDAKAITLEASLLNSTFTYGRTYETYMAAALIKISKNLRKERDTHFN